MMRVGMRELRQNPAAAVAAARSGEVVLVTDRGRDVAQLTPPPDDIREQLIASGRLIPATTPRAELPPPLPPREGESLSEILARMREHER
ncbi:MAG: type II toxin-antitoxin system prevent-host-death family antitoxin [Bifidobacteriaceae bacterium]|jgi:prevent-host-death family protein|nr:type II toxin-antitoxin system prevent-host-death family antitoxin [Bifidobacteriaceae bacterium]